MIASGVINARGQEHTINHRLSGLISRSGSATIFHRDLRTMRASVSFKRIAMAVGIGTLGTLGGGSLYLKYRPAHRKPNLVWDLDGTLVFTRPSAAPAVSLCKAACTSASPPSPPPPAAAASALVPASASDDITTKAPESCALQLSCDFTVKLKEACYDVWVRPHARWVLRALSHFANLYLFTAATPEYADAIVDAAFAAHVFPRANRFYRSSCVDSRGHGKDLRTVDAVRWPKSILIDDRLSNRQNGQNFYLLQPFDPRRWTPDRQLLRVFGMCMSSCVWGVSNHTRSLSR